MKLLRNPVVVGFLALAAVVVVLYQSFGAKWLRERAVPGAVQLGSAKAEKPAPPPPAPKPAGVVVTIPAATFTNVDAALLPARGVERSAVERQFKNWISAPLRDPFLLLSAVPENPASLDETNSPVPTWRLAAIWNQTDSRVAVINIGTDAQPNQRVYQAGEEVVEHYKVLRIEKDEVWIQGPRFNERLGFREQRKTADLPKGKEDPQSQVSSAVRRPQFSPVTTTIDRSP